MHIFIFFYLIFQIKELLHEMKLTFNKSVRVKKCIEQLKITLLNLPQGEKYQVSHYFHPL